MEKIIVIRPDDKIELADYTDFRSLQETVNGSIEHFHTGKIKTIASTIPIDLYCNDSFLIDSNKDFDKLNAVASLISGQEIRGNVAMVVSQEEGANRGFDYQETPDGEEDLCECWYAEDSLLLFIKHHQAQLLSLHRQFDNNKSKPTCEIISW